MRDQRATIVTGVRRNAISSPPFSRARLAIFADAV
jgi:hypothetical protein